jgi:type VI secretion system secreted protein Hcp
MPIPAHVWIQGENQGEIRGSCPMSGRENSIRVFEVNHEIEIPLDRRTGIATGHRVHHPLTILKEMDRSTPQLFHAMATNERLTRVEIKWYRIDEAGREEHYFTTLLEDSVVSKIRSFMPNTLNTQYQHWTHHEEVSFAYRSIRWTQELVGVETVDTWSTPRT